MQSARVGRASGRFHEWPQHARCTAHVVFRSIKFGTLRRELDRINRRARKKRRPPSVSRAPIGPTLVRGRGRRRRRVLRNIAQVTLYLTLATALAIFLFKYYVVPVLPG